MYLNPVLVKCFESTNNHRMNDLTFFSCEKKEEKGNCEREIYSGRINGRVLD